MCLVCDIYATHSSVTGVRLSLESLPLVHIGGVSLVAIAFCYDSKPHPTSNHILLWQIGQSCMYISESIGL